MLQSRVITELVSDALVLIGNNEASDERKLIASLYRKIIISKERWCKHKISGFILTVIKGCFCSEWIKPEGSQKAERSEDICDAY